MSYPRHEYFRRVLCNLIGADVENGLLPDNEDLIARLITDLCFTNAADYFALPLGDMTKSKLKPLTKD
jgi:glucuronate isomerase